MPRISVSDNSDLIVVRLLVVLNMRKGEREKTTCVKSGVSAGEPMPARPSAGPSDQSTPDGRKLHPHHKQLVSAGCRLIARRASGGIGAVGDHSMSSPFLPFSCSLGKSQTVIEAKILSQDSALRTNTLGIGSSGDD